MKIICVINQKGGVGKTTSTFNIGFGLRRQKKKVLLIDFDAQATLTKSFGIVGEAQRYTVFDLMQKKCTFAEVVVQQSGVDLIPSNVLLSGAEKVLGREPGADYFLKRAIDKCARGYDFVLIDCPPSLGFLSVNALTAAHEVLIPIQTDNYSLMGTADLLDTIEVIQERVNPELKISGVFATSFDQRNTLDKESLALIQEAFPEKMFKQVIRKNITLRESVARHQDIFTYDPKSHGAEDYSKLTKEIIQRSV